MQTVVDLTPDDVLGGEAGSRYRERLAAEHDDHRTWVDPKGYRLSDRLWSAKHADREAIEKELRYGLATGRDSLETARRVEQYLLPTPEAQAVTGRPRGGSGLYSARRLARTETTRSFGKATEDASRRNPWLGYLRWRLSASHPKIDVCDGYAANGSAGQDRGVYAIDEAPAYPAHPHCLCTIAAVPPKDGPTTDQIVAALREKYGLATPARSRYGVAPLRQPSEVADYLAERGVQRLGRGLAGDADLGDVVPDSFLDAAERDFANALRNAEAATGQSLDVGAVEFVRDGFGEPAAAYLPGNPIAGRRGAMRINLDSNELTHPNLLSKYPATAYDSLGDVFTGEIGRGFDAQRITRNRVVDWAPMDAGEFDGWLDEAVEGFADWTDAERAVASRLSTDAGIGRGAFVREAFAKQIRDGDLGDDAADLYRALDGPKVYGSAADATVAAAADEAAYLAEQAALRQRIGMAAEEVRVAREAAEAAAREADRLALEAERAAARAEVERVATERARARAESRTGGTIDQTLRDNRGKVAEDRWALEWNLAKKDVAKTATSAATKDARKAIKGLQPGQVKNAARPVARQTAYDAAKTAADDVANRLVRVDDLAADFEAAARRALNPSWGDNLLNPDVADRTLGVGNARLSAAKVARQEIADEITDDLYEAAYDAAYRRAMDDLIGDRARLAGEQAKDYVVTSKTAKRAAELADEVAEKVADKLYAEAAKKAAKLRASNPPQVPAGRLTGTTADGIDYGATRERMIANGYDDSWDRFNARAGGRANYQMEKDYNDDLYKAADKAKKNLTPDEAALIRNYKNGDYRDMNLYLRGNGPDGNTYGATRSFKYSEAEGIINDGLGRSRSTMDGVIHRGTSISRPEQRAVYENAVPGTIIDEKGYFSAATRAASRWERGNEATRVTYEIYVPKGAPGLQLEALMAMGEEEFLVPSNLRYQVLDVQRKPSGWLHVIGEWLPEGVS